MSATLVLILVVIGAYLAAHVMFEWIARRFLIVSGAEYLLLGILLGPHVTGLIGTSVVSNFAPLMILALGGMGLLVGTGLRIPEMRRLRSVHFRVATLEAVLVLLTVAGVMALGLQLVFEMSARQTAVSAAALGIIATASAPSGVILVTRHLRGRGVVMDQLTVTDWVNGAVAIVAFAFLLCLVRVDPAADGVSLAPIQWMIINVGIGLFGGVLFHLFLGNDKEPDRLAVALIGAIILTTGAAAYLQLSPLLPTFLVGVILVNTSPVQKQIRELLARVERPFYYALLIFAGAAWRPGSDAWIAPIVLFLAIQAAAAIGGARLASRVNGTTRALGPNWGLAMLGHGELALAIGFNYLIHQAAPLADLVFSATIASVLLTHFTSARFVRSVAQDTASPVTAPISGNR